MATAIRNDLAFPTTRVRSESGIAVSVGNRRLAIAADRNSGVPGLAVSAPLQMIDNAFNGPIPSAEGAS